MSIFLWDTSPSKIFIWDTEVSKVFVWDTKVRPEWGGGWTPWANTIAYFPFSSNAIDVTGNNTLTNSWTQDWLWRKFTSASDITTPSWTVAYVNYRIKINAYPSYYLNSATCLSNQKGMGYYSNHATDTRVNKKIFVWYDSSFNAWSVTFQPTIWTRHNISYGYDWTKTIYSIDGTTWTLYNGSGYNFGDTFIVSQGNDITISKLILETIARTSQEIADYYNQTKSEYGL